MRLGDAATGQAGWGQVFDPARLWPVRYAARAGSGRLIANENGPDHRPVFGLRDAVLGGTLTTAGRAHFVKISLPARVMRRV